MLWAVGVFHLKGHNIRRVELQGICVEKQLLDRNELLRFTCTSPARQDSFLPCLHCFVGCLAPHLHPCFLRYPPFQLIFNYPWLLCTVDDGTGCVACVLWLNELREEEVGDISLGRLITIRGRPVVYQGNHQVRNHAEI